MDLFLESCCTSLSEVRYACEHGARRIELCENLNVGGVTPSKGLLEEVLRLSPVPVNVLVRPRAGDFCYGEDEISLMIETICLCRDIGAAGVVLGALDRKGDVDLTTMERLLDATGKSGGSLRALSVTFHRAFDVCRDPIAAFDTIRRLGCDRLLTSGHSDNAFSGRFFIAELVRQTKEDGNPIVVMPGCGVRAANIDEISRITRATEFHASVSFWK